MKISRRYEISGLVQGVGFRPFVYVLADRLGLFGEIYNDDEGVKIEFYGKQNALDEFEKALFSELPALARIDGFKVFTSKQEFHDLQIVASKSANKSAPILPDFALCADCEREFHDPNNPRFEYAFINCTNCGPRFSIIKSLPYDRINTTMSKFVMCSECKSEYENPLNRRYHAQPTSCPNCGPTLMFKDKSGKILSKNQQAIKECAAAIKSGKIVAIKGLGGFHLCCDASNQNALSELRARKHRPDKPFAIMCKDLQSAQQIAQISDLEKELLSSNLKPIVLVDSRQNSTLAPLVAPNLNKLGIMLPFSGIHLALFKHLDCYIIATSANISGEPVIYDEHELLRALDGVIDYYLDHDREIYSPSDDSIAFVADGKICYSRTSRGLNPYFMNVKTPKNGTFIALGAELKNQFVIYHNGEIMISPYIRDLKNVATFERFERVLQLFKDIYELKFDVAIADLHPHFLNTKFAKSSGIKTIQIQHHYAHLLSVMFEHELPKDSEYLGFCFDGTGLGTDGKIWGGEVMLVQGAQFKRLWHFDEFALIGGENSIKNIWQIAYAIILKYDLEDDASEFLSKFDSVKLKTLKQLCQSGSGCVQTSSLGRLFDAFASVILGLNTITYEAQSGMELDKFYDANLDYTYEFKLKNGVIDFKDAFAKALKDDARHATTGFINAIVNFVVKISASQQNSVLLSGGVFQNTTLLNQISQKLRAKKVKFYFNQRHCSNDTNVALGQMYYFLFLI